MVGTNKLQGDILVMAGDKVNTYAQDDSDILALQLTTDKTFKGYHQLTLTNYYNTTVPAIAAGSAIEVNGALYKFDTEEAISTTDPVTSATVADGTVYIVIVPGATTATAAFTATAPTWSDSKQGWYGTGGQANYRYAEYAIYKATTNYYKSLKGYNIKRYEIGAWNMVSTALIELNIEIPEINIIGVSIIIYDDVNSMFTSSEGIYFNYTASSGKYYLYRIGGGRFDTDSFNDSVMNRGHVNIKYSYWI